MKIAVLSRHRRLLALCGISAALHLLVLQLIARHAAREPAPGPGASEALVLRLAPAPHAAAPAAPALQPEAARPAQPPPPILPAPKPAPDASTPARPDRPAEAARAAPAPGPAAAPPPATATATAAASGAGGAPSGDTMALRMPARYRVRMPPSVRLVYRVTGRDAAGKETPPHEARLDWRNDGGRYTLHMDGVLGQVASSGEDSDSGIQPEHFNGRDGAGQVDIAFDPAQGRIVFGDGSAAPGAAGMQDRASLLMQLAGIGLARPEQLQDVIEIVVADAGAARIERFQVLPEEALETGAGTLRAAHLAELAPPGQARVEVWLAPDQGWLPVQLRVTRPDGSSATQTLARSEAAAAP